jgi:uncharacterized protein YbjT (DUF2867 family)
MNYRTAQRIVEGAAEYRQRQLKRLFAAAHTDSAPMEDALRASGLDWTIMRPPRLTNKPATGQYRAAIDQNVRRGRSISRADFAHFMLDVINKPRHRWTHDRYRLLNGHPRDRKDRGSWDDCRTVRGWGPLWDHALCTSTK